MPRMRGFCVNRLLLPGASQWIPSKPNRDARFCKSSMAGTGEQCRAQRPWPCSAIASCGGGGHNSALGRLTTRRQPVRRAVATRVHDRSSPTLADGSADGGGGDRYVAHVESAGAIAVRCGRQDDADGSPVIWATGRLLHGAARLPRGSPAVRVGAGVTLASRTRHEERTLPGGAQRADRDGRGRHAAHLDGDVLPLPRVREHLDTPRPAERQSGRSQAHGPDTSLALSASARPS